MGGVVWASRNQMKMTLELAFCFQGRIFPLVVGLAKESITDR